MPKRKKILHFLKNFQPFDQKEAEDVVKIISLIKEHRNIFERKCLDCHLTASALVANSNTGKFLLHKHKKLNRWLQFGGHADGETNLSSVAIKEAKEETGLQDLEFFSKRSIDVDLQIIPEIQNQPEHFHLDMRYLLITKTIRVPSPQKGESQELAFFSFTELERMKDKLDISLFRLIQKSNKLLFLKN